MLKLFYVMVLANALVLSLGHSRYTRCNDLGHSDNDRKCSCNKGHSNDDDDSDSVAEVIPIKKPKYRPVPKMRPRIESENSSDKESETSTESDDESESENSEESENNSDEKSENNINSDEESDNDIESENDIESDKESDSEIGIESEKSCTELDKELELENNTDSENESDLEEEKDAETDNNINFDNKCNEEPENNINNDTEDNIEKQTDTYYRGRQNDDENMIEAENDQVYCSEAFNKFREGLLRASVKFLKTYATSVPEETGAISPLATLFSVGALAFFAYGETKSEIYTLLNLSSRNEVECVYRTINEIVHNLPNTVNFKLITNYFGNVCCPFTKRFKEKMKNIVGGVAENVNFLRSKQAAEKINKKIFLQTNKKIKTVIESKDLFNKTTELVAVSGLFFSSSWNIEFTTTDKITEFKVSHGEKVPTDFMYQLAVYNYTHSTFLNSKVLQLNLKDNIFEVLVVLPDVQFMENDVIKKMHNNPTKWYKSLQKSMKPKKVEVYIPVYDQSSWIDLMALLIQSTDLETLYSGDTIRLKGVVQGDSDAGISAGRQKIHIDLAYEGEPAKKLLRRGAAVKFKANYPFIFFIFLKGIVVFNGIYRSPIV